MRFNPAQEDEEATPATKFLHFFSQKYEDDIIQIQKHQERIKEFEAKIHSERQLAKEVWSRIGVRLTN